MKEEIAKVLQKALKEKKVILKKEEIMKLIEIPPSQDMGDFSFPCFFLAGKLKKEPHQIALEIREKIGTPTAVDFDDIQVVGPYVNFFSDRKNMARKVVWEAITQKEKYGRGIIGKKKKELIS